MKSTFRAASVALVLALGCTLAACAAPVEQKAAPLNSNQLAMLEDQLGGKVAGEPVSCLSLPRTDQAIRVSDNILLYRVSSRLVYRNDLRYRCPGLVRGDDLIVTRTLGAQLCDGDILRLVDRTSGITAASCSLGQFTPYRTPADG